MTFVDCGYAWTKNLEGVLEDGVALDVFKRWIRENNPQAKNALDLYFAIKAFRELVEKSDVNAREFACKIHRKYISKNTGCCDFLPLTVRKEISDRAHALTNSNPPRTLFFGPCTEHILSYLRKQYDIFISSTHFQELCSRSFVVEDLPSTSYARNPPLPPHQNITKSVQTSCSSTDWPRKPNKTPRPLRPTQNLHAVIGKSSKNDWDMQICASSEDTSKRSSTRKQFDSRANNANFAFSPHMGESSRYTHEIAEGRERFVAVLSSKLQVVADAIEQRERETGREIFASELTSHITAKDCGSTTKEHKKNDEEIDSVFSDDDSTNDVLDKYEKRMNDESDKQPAGKNDHPRSASMSPVRFDDRFSKIYNSIPNPYGNTGFAPMAGTIRSQDSYSFGYSHISHGPRSAIPMTSVYGGHRLSDSSGFCSAESANIVNMGALYRKARHIAAQECSTQSATMSRSGFAMHHSPFHAIATMPRQDRNSTNYPMGPERSLLTVSYKEEHGEAPFVAKLPEKEITFRDFRRCFGISSRSNKKFFFKSECEDGSAPYQWTTISEDSAYLPVFQGRVTAECRTFSESD